jgi:hypothetical protein
MSEMDNVVVVRFDEPSKAYEALSVIKGCAAEGRIGLEEAVVVERTAEGNLRTVERTDNDELVGTARRAGRLGRGRCHGRRLGHQPRRGLQRGDCAAEPGDHAGIERAHGERERAGRRGARR